MEKFYKENFNIGDIVECIQPKSDASRGFDLLANVHYIIETVDHLSITLKGHGERGFQRSRFRKIKYTFLTIKII